MLDKPSHIESSLCQVAASSPLLGAPKQSVVDGD